MSMEDPEETPNGTESNALQQILKDLSVMAQKLHTDPSYCGEMICMLKGCNYDWFDAEFEKESDEHYKKQLKEDVKRVFAVAVYEAIQKNFKVEPVKKVNSNNMVLNDKLLEILERGIKKKEMNDYFSRLDVEDSSPITSPLDLAKYLKRKKVPQRLVKNMIQYQFEIKWLPPKSDSQQPSGSDEDCLEPVGEPADFTFYEFYHMEETKKVSKYMLRQAHVKATLYKELRRKPKRGKKKLYDLLGKSKNFFCPKVYIKTVRGWKIWEAYNQDQTNGRFSNLSSLSEVCTWIDKDILKFIEENADVQKETPDLKKHTLYWAVLKDSDFDSKKLSSTPISETQVYVGKANRGIWGRWINDSDNHCKMMKKCVDDVWAMTTYDPLRLEGIQLVDARLALAKVKEERTALFVMKTFGDDLEKAKNNLDKAEDKLRIAEEELRIAEEKRNSGSSSGPVLAEASSEVDSISGKIQNLKAGIEELKKKLKKAGHPQSRDTKVITQQLEKAEKRHLEGKKNLKSKIFSNNKQWKPTDMMYGMNGRD